MRIVKNIEEPTVKFEDLMIGDVFLDGDENVCIKVPEVYNDFSGAETESLLEGCMDADEFEEHKYNAISLNDMQYHYFDDFEDVIFKPSKLIVE